MPSARPRLRRNQLTIAELKPTPSVALMPSEISPNEANSIHSARSWLSDISPSAVTSTPAITTGRAP